MYAYMYVCMIVCMYVRMYVRMHVYIHTHIHIHAYIHTRTQTHNAGWADNCGLSNLTQYDKAYKLVTGGQTHITAGEPYETGCKIYVNETPGQFDGMYPLDPFGRYHNCQLYDFLAGSRNSANSPQVR